jgi:hypothetical protein
MARPTGTSDFSPSVVKAEEMATDKRPMEAVLQYSSRQSGGVARKTVDGPGRRGEGEGGSRPDFAGRRSGAAVIGGGFYYAV